MRLHAPGATVLILGYTPPQKARLLSELSLTQTVFSARYAKALDAAASDAGRVIAVHFKTDGGMTRLGFSPDGAREIRDSAEACPMLLPTGIYTHFPRVSVIAGKMLGKAARFAGSPAFLPP